MVPDKVGQAAGLCWKLKVCFSDLEKTLGGKKKTFWKSTQIEATRRKKDRKHTSPDFKLKGLMTAYVYVYIYISYDIPMSKTWVDQQHQAQLYQLPRSRWVPAFEDFDTWFGLVGVKDLLFWVLLMSQGSVYDMIPKGFIHTIHLRLDSILCAPLAGSKLPMYIYI